MTQPDTSAYRAEPIGPAGIEPVAPDILNTPTLLGLGDAVRTNESLIFEGGQLTQRHTGVFRQTAGDDQRAAAAAGDTLRSARNAKGIPVPPSAIDGACLVTLANGLEAKVSDLESMGLILKDANGYRMASEQETAAAQHEPVQQQEAGPKIEALPADAEADLAKFASAVGPGAQIAAIAEVARDGALSAHTAGQIASQLGVEPHEAESIVAGLHGHFAQQAAQVVADQGIDPISFHEWASANHANQLSAAMRDQAMSRSTVGYRNLCQTYYASLDKIDPDAVKTAQLGEGVQVMEQDGKILVRVGGMQMPWASAVKSGVIKLGKPR